MSSEKITILLPALNEKAGLEQIFPKISRDWYDQMILLDGGSTDGTIELALSYGCQIVTQKQPSLRMAYMECFPHIQGDIVVVCSADGNAKPEAIPILIAKIREGFDLVIGSRYAPGAQSEDDTFLTGIGNYIFSKLIGLFGYPYTDALVQLRAYRRHVPEVLGLTKLDNAAFEAVFGSYAGWEPLMSIRAAKRGMKISEIPSSEPPRIEPLPNRMIGLPTSRVPHIRGALAICGMLITEPFRSK